MKRCLFACNHMTSRDWSGLPTDVLLCIIDKLRLVEDHARFAAVCRPWRDAFHEEISSGVRPSCCRLPLLLVAAPPPPQKVNRRHRPIYSLSRGRLYDFRLPVPHTHVCRGSSLGWLITLRTRYPSSFSIRLQNPFLNRTIDLPPPPLGFFELHPDNVANVGFVEWKGYNVWKAVLSSDPSLQPHAFVVMAIMGKYRGLAFYKAGNTTWTPIGRDNWYSQFLQNTHFTDVIFSVRTNQFYALDADGQVFTLDFPRDNHIPKLRQVAPSPHGPGFMLYLVQDSSSGDLFQVHKDDSKRGNHYTLVLLCSNSTLATKNGSKWIP